MENKHSSIWLTGDAIEALEYLQSLPGGFNLSRYVRDALIALAQQRGWEE